jgi:histidinol-phosphatase (PHP family)
VLTDFHLHLAPDGERLTPAALALDHVREYVATAVARGIEEIAITEHVHRFTAARGLLDHPFWQASCVDDIDTYRAALRAARDAGLPVLAGIELDWIEGKAEPLRVLARSYEWDIVLGSVHWLGSLAVDHPDYSIYDVYPADHVWELYTAAFCAAASSGLYDVMAHPDLPKVFGNRPSPVVLEAAYRDMVDALFDSGVAIEVSTAGLRKAAAELYPAGALLERCARVGIPVTLGSDAHVPDDVGRDFGAAVAALHAVGCRSLVRFSGRLPEPVPLG